MENGLTVVRMVKVVDLLFECLLVFEVMPCSLVRVAEEGQKVTSVGTLRSGGVRGPLRDTGLDAVCLSQRVSWEYQGCWASEVCALLNNPLLAQT